MATTRHLRPALDIEGALTPLPRWPADLAREGSHSRRHDNALARLQGPRLAEGLIVQPDGRIDGLGDPIERDGREQLVLAESTLDISMAVAPGPVFFYDPGRQARR